MIYHLLDQDAPRLDRFLVAHHPELPRSQWEMWIREGHVRINGTPATKPGTRLKAGEVVETELPQRTPPGSHALPEPMDVPTLFEDDRLWVVDKPSGMVVHPGPGHPGGTLLNALLARMATSAPTPAVPEVADEHEEEEVAVPWPGLVHRLDRYTTGCLVMAKDGAAQTHLQAQFKARTVEKRYLALARMSRRLPELGTLLVDEPIARHRVERLKMTLAAHGRPSQTRVRVIAKACGLALLECELLTGRTHQIRVHLGHLGAPLLGDPLYGGASRWQDADKRPLVCEQPMLHAWRLAVDHPGSGERLQFQAPLPLRFREILEQLGLGAVAAGLG